MGHAEKGLLEDCSTSLAFIFEAPFTSKLLDDPEGPRSWAEMMMYTRLPMA